MALTLVTFVAATKIKSAEVNSNFSLINSELFSLRNVNIASDAAILDTKLATIATPGKINGAAITSQTIDAVKGQFMWTLPGDMALGTNVAPIYESSAVLTPISVTMHVKVNPTGAALIVDINRNGTSIFTTEPEIAAGAVLGGGNAVFVVSTVFADTDLLTLDIDQIGSTLEGTDLTVILKCEQKVPQ